MMNDELRGAHAVHVHEGVMQCTAVMQSCSLKPSKFGVRCSPDISGQALFDDIMDRNKKLESITIK